MKICITLPRYHAFHGFRLTGRTVKHLALVVFFTAFAFWGPRSLSAQIIELEPVLAGYIREALEKNPNLDVWHSRVEAASERIDQAGAWPDPALGFSIANLPTNTFAFDQEPMTAAWISAGQRIPLGGKPSMHVKVARSELDALMSREEAEGFAIAEEIVQTWYDWAYLRESIRTVDANIELISDLISVARRKYETGRGLHQDILRAETERARLEDRRAALRQMALTAGRRIAILMGRPPDDLPSPPDSLIQSFGALDRDDLLRRLRTVNPDLKKMEAELAAAESRVGLARRNWWPDLNLGVAYGFRQSAGDGVDRPDFFTASAGISVPLYGARKQGRAVEEAKAVRREIAAKLRSVELELLFYLERFLDRDRRLDEQIQLYYQGVEPQAVAALAAATAEYTVGRVDFEAILMAEAALYNARLERYARLRDRLKVRASIAALVRDDGLIAAMDN